VEFWENKKYVVSVETIVNGLKDCGSFVNCTQNPKYFFAFKDSS